MQNNGLIVACQVPDESISPKSSTQRRKTLPLDQAMIITHIAVVASKAAMEGYTSYLIPQELLGCEYQEVMRQAKLGKTGPLFAVLKKMRTRQKLSPSSCASFPRWENLKFPSEKGYSGKGDSSTQAQFYTAPKLMGFIKEGRILFSK